ncbi:MAG: hypothetical protein Q4B48_01450 [Syntrophomonadaceae bacterium]|nr:hypothetical protein [Syntrophomonadaceae bacterium]
MKSKPQKLSALALLLTALLLLSGCGGGKEYEAAPQALIYIEGTGISEQYPILYRGNLNHTKLADGLSSVLGVPVEVRRIGVNYQDEANGVSIDLDMKSAPIVFFEDVKAALTCPAADAAEYERLVMNSIYLTFQMNLPECWDKTFYFTVDGGKPYAMLYTGRISDTDPFMPLESAVLMLDEERKARGAHDAVAAIAGSKGPLTEAQALELVRWYAAETMDAVYANAAIIYRSEGEIEVEGKAGYSFYVGEDRDSHTVLIDRYAVDMSDGTLYKYDGLGDKYREVAL